MERSSMLYFLYYCSFVILLSDTLYILNSQSSLPENGVPFAFILYADKTHLSSAGTVKAYPVFVRCGNLPVNIRNTDGLGGGRMVGWLPIVSEISVSSEFRAKQFFCAGS